MQSSKNSKLTTQQLFLILASIGIIWNIALLILTNGGFWETLMGQGGNSFDDITRPLSAYYTYDNVYQGGLDMCFPPLAYTIYNLLAKTMVCFGFTTQASILANPTGLMICTFFVTVTFCILIACFVLSMEGETWENLLMAGVLTLSFPLLIAFNQGSAVLIVGPLLIGALKLRKSEKKWCRELSMIMVAVAAGIKIYPAILGLLWIKEKRYKEAFRLVIYGIVFFFGPFVFFGGTEGIRLWISNVTQLNGLESVLRFQSQDITGLTMFILKRFVGEQSAYSVGKILSLIYFAVILVLFLLSRLNWKRITLLISLMIIFVCPSHSYTYVYLCAPLLLFFTETKNEHLGWKNILYTILWSMIFVTWPVGNYRAYLMTGAVYILLLFLFVDTLIEVKST